MKVVATCAFFPNAFLFRIMAAQAAFTVFDHATI
jgi:hypothetical protein